MSARVLVVDDIEANLRLLQAKLERAYFEVITATRGEEAVQKARREQPDIILLDIMMPGLDGFETCRRLKAAEETRHIPVVMVTTLDGREDRLKGLKAGAEDFLTKPIDDVQLLARVKSLVRLKIVADELRAREANGVRLGVIGESANGLGGALREAAGRVLVVDDNPRQVARVRAALGGEHAVVMFGEAGAKVPPDLIVVSLTASFDGCKVIATLRASDTTRQTPILAIFEPGENERALRALDLGAHDIIARPIDEEELAARARTLMRRKRHVDALRARLDQSLELAVTDPLTGLYNRRFLITQLPALVQRAGHGGDPLSLVMIDIDHFKQINDAHGHDAGDVVLREFAARFASHVRPADFACRFGGEEFALIMPNADGATACLAAERLRRQIAGAPFQAGAAIEVTLSAGVAQADESDETAESLLKRADEALYEAKRAGRNRVIGRGAAKVA